MLLVYKMLRSRSKTHYMRTRVGCLTAEAVKGGRGVSREGTVYDVRMCYAEGGLAVESDATLDA
jgi:hypothetical protein